MEQIRPYVKIVGISPAPGLDYLAYWGPSVCSWIGPSGVTSPLCCALLDLPLSFAVAIVALLPNLYYIGREPLLCFPRL